MEEKHIMFIDDDQEEVEIFIEFAQKCTVPLKVHSAVNALEGIILMKSLEQIDVIFLDVNMPKVSGFDVVKRIKADEQLSQIPIIVMSSSKSEFIEHKALLSGAFSFMIKSANYQDYCREIIKAIESTSGK